MTARMLALFLGGFTLLNIAGDMAKPGFDANLWWIDLRPLPEGLADAVLLAASILLVAYAACPVVGPARFHATRTAVIVLLAFVCCNILTFYFLVALGDVTTSFPVPLSLFIAAAMAAILRAVTRAGFVRGQLAGRLAGEPSLGRNSRRRDLLFGAAVLLACVVGFPLAQMLCFGKTDYRRKADVVVVFGAGVYADGTPSDALIDRVRTGCDLYKQGLARRIIFSGGPGQGSIHETRAMRDLAMKFGVAEQAIILDEGGVNTQSTARNTAAMFPAIGAGRVLVVSHFYHLPRVKMTYRRLGVDVYTVPARESYLLTAMPYYMAREIAALWAYYLRA